MGFFPVCLRESASERELLDLIEGSGARWQKSTMRRECEVGRQWRFAFKKLGAACVGSVALASSSQ
jgi:hypothetical protein